MLDQSKKSRGKGNKAVVGEARATYKKKNKLKVKLTLSIDPDLLVKAKLAARASKRSLSSLVENALRDLSKPVIKKTPISDALEGTLRDQFKGLTYKEMRDIMYKEKYDNKYGI